MMLVFVNTLLILGTVIFLLGITGSLAAKRDNTDGPNGRSGLQLLTDCGTGLQYLSVATGGITPRLDENGNHMKQDCGS